ncbi:MAG: undecaprenyl-diphosphatase UppP [Chloroflexi bacterium]|nr:undecaprenyl-diphosphatase UppP [Chloroflexota bacterium]
MDILQAIVLGIVQGSTEFIPISSSAHLIIIPWLFGWQDPGLAFDVALHLGTLLALLLFFANDWIRLIRAGIASIIERKIGDDTDRRLAWLLVIGCIPGGIAGVLAESKIEELFHQPNGAHNSSAMIAMAIIIALLGAALFIAERVARHVRELQSVTLKDAIIIGLAQALAIFPGVSRSGATITAGMFIGLTREAAARFSFLLSAPIIAGAGAKSMLNVAGELRSGAMASSELVYFAIGFIAAAISGYLCIRFLLQFLQKNSVDVFVYYRWLLAIFLIVVVLARG